MNGPSIVMTRGLTPAARSTGISAHRTSATSGASAVPSQTPFTSVRRLSCWSLAPNAWATRVSMPSSMPVPQMAMGKKTMPPRLPVPTAAGAQGSGHHGIHDAHEHPAEFRHGQRRGQPEHGPEFTAKFGEGDHADHCGAGSLRKARGLSMKPLVRDAARMLRTPDVVGSAVQGRAAARLNLLTIGPQAAQLPHKMGSFPAPADAGRDLRKRRASTRVSRRQTAKFGEQTAPSRSRL